ncbi:WD40-repeat-containing domain protein [Dipodascopsis uninucleata]
MGPPQDFLKQWTYQGVLHDFQLNNEPPSWADGNPLSWGNEISKLQFVEEATAAAVSKDSRLLAIALLSRILIYALSDLTLLNELVGHHGYISHLEFNVHPLHSDHYILLSYADYFRKEISQFDNIIIWEIDSLGQRLCGETSIAEFSVQNLTEKSLISLQGEINDESFYAADCINEDNLYENIYDNLINARSKYLTRDLITLRGLILTESATTIADDGRLVLYSGEDRTKTIAFDILYRRERFILTERPKDGAIGFNNIAISPDSHMIAYARDKNTLAIVDSRSGTSLIDIEEDYDIGASIAFSQDSQYIAYSSVRVVLIIRRVSDGSLIFKGPTSKSYLFVTGLHWNPSGTLIAFKMCGTLYIWDSCSGKLVQRWKLKIDDMMLLNYFGPSGIQWPGNKIAFKSIDWAVNVYDMVENMAWRFYPGIETSGYQLTDNQLKNLQNQLHYLPSRNQLLSIDLDGALRFWQVE